MILAVAAAGANAAPDDDAARVAARAAADAVDDELTQATLAYRNASRAGRPSEALAPAQRVVALTELTQPGSAALGSALRDLGVVQLQLGDNAAAIASFERAVDVLEAVHGPDAATLITPLGGLGIALNAEARHDEAIAVLDRALDNPFRPTVTGPRDTLSMLDTLVASRRVLGHVEAGDRRVTQAMALASSIMAPDDLQLVPRLQDLGGWYEATGRRDEAATIYRRAIAIAEGAGANGRAALVESLTLLSRALPRRGSGVGASLWGLPSVMPTGPTVNPRAEAAPTGPQFVDNGSLLEQQGNTPLSPDGVVGSGAGMTARGRVRKPDEEGAAAIQRAVAIVRADASLSPSLRSDTLIYAGDWHAIHRRHRDAGRLWVEAMSLAGHAGELSRQRLAEPRALAYPVSGWQIANASRRTPQSVTVEGRFEFEVTAKGVVWEVKYLGGGLSTDQILETRSALIRTPYAPRFEGTTPVATEGVTFTSTWYRNP